MEDKRYELVWNEEGEGCRIRALVDMPHVNVKAGDVGGIVDSEYNLVQDGFGWIDYNSSVIGKSVVLDAWVKGRSTITGNSFVSSGTVLNSTISNTQFQGDTDVESSYFDNCGFLLYCKASDSNLTHVLAYEEAVFHDCIWNSRKQARFRKCLLESVDIKNDSAKFTNELELRDVMGHIETIKSDVPVIINHARFHFGIKELSMTEPPMYFSKVINDSKVQIVGLKESPIRIHVPTLHLYDVLIKGEIRMDGEHQGIYASTILDNAVINMTGTAQYLEMREFSQIVLDTEKQQGIKQLQLSGDMVYTN